MQALSPADRHRSLASLGTPGARWWTARHSCSAWARSRRRADPPRGHRCNSPRQCRSGTRDCNAEASAARCPGPPSFQLAQGCEQLGRCNAGDGTTAHIGKYVFLERVEHRLNIGRNPALLLLVDPVARHDVEGVRLGQLYRLLLLFAGIDRIESLLDQRLRVVSCLACTGQRYVGVHAEREELFLAGMTIFKAPVLRAIRFDQEIQTTRVSELVGLRSALQSSA